MFAGIEGTRPLLVEIQALVAPTSLGTPRRAVVGWDQSRLSMVLAVLQAHCGVNLGGHDVYLNVAGGLRIVEPAADLAAAAALVSSLANAPLPADAVYFGEVSLSGAVRPVAQAAARLKEAQKLGFARAVVPEAGARGRSDSGLALNAVGNAGRASSSDIAARGEKRRQNRGRARPRRRSDAAAPGRYTRPRMPAVEPRTPKNDTKLNHWADMPRPLPSCRSGQVSVGARPIPIRPTAARFATRSPATLSDPCRSRGSIFSCSA